MRSGTKGCIAVSAMAMAAAGTVAMPVAHADTLDDLRGAVNGVRAQSPCGALNYNIDLEGNAQAVAGNRNPGVPPSGRYNGSTVEAKIVQDPTSEAIQSLLNGNAGAIKDCRYKDFGVGFVRGDGFSVVALALGEPKAAPPPPPPPKREFGTEPIVDTDGDGLPDSTEATLGSDPRNPNDPMDRGPAGPRPGPTVTPREGLTGVTFTVTDRSGVASQCTYSSEGFEKGFGLPANGTVDVFVPAIRLFKQRTGTITCDNGTSTNTSVFY